MPIETFPDDMALSSGIYRYATDLILYDSYMVAYFLSRAEADEMLNWLLYTTVVAFAAALIVFATSLPDTGTPSNRFTGFAFPVFG